MKNKIPVAVLAATGSVGQRFVQLLDNHPWFKVVALSGSERGYNRNYGEVCRWILPGDMPQWARNMPVLQSTPDAISAPLVFSGLPADVAREVEPLFAQAGSVVCSNASAYRRTPEVPILLPEVNPDHIELIKVQHKVRGWPGGIVTNPNCTSTGMTIALKPLSQAFGLQKIFAVSLQALSGAGYPGVASMDIIDNVIPFVNGEEEKIEWECRKMLGSLGEKEIILADWVISAHTNRVAVSDGHIVCLSIQFTNKAEIDEVVNALKSYPLPEACIGLPSAPQPPIIVREEQDRPQPRLDRSSGNGMTTVVGKIRKDPIFDIKMVVLSHNTIRGAAGGAILNAELLVKSGITGLTIPV